MTPLESWVWLLSLAGGIVWVLVQAYRLEKWKEENE